MIYGNILVSRQKGFLPKDRVHEWRGFGLDWFSGEGKPAHWEKTPDYCFAAVSPADHT